MRAEDFVITLRDLFIASSTPFISSISGNYMYCPTAADTYKENNKVKRRATDYAVKRDNKRSY